MRELSDSISRPQALTGHLSYPGGRLIIGATTDGHRPKERGIMAKVKGATLSWNPNYKMSVGRFNLPSKRTCPGSTAQCRAKCYAKKAETYRPTVLPCRMRNVNATYASSFVNDVVGMFRRKRKSVTHFRIHESGDFYNQAYLDKWIEIANQLPDTQFLAFTKSFHLDYSRMPSNLTIIWSVWPDSVGVPASGRYAYAGECGHADMVECVGHCDDCMVCWTVDCDVHFKIH